MRSNKLFLQIISSGYKEVPRGREGARGASQGACPDVLTQQLTPPPPPGSALLIQLQAPRTWPGGGTQRTLVPFSPSTSCPGIILRKGPGRGREGGGQCNTDMHCDWQGTRQRAYKLFTRLSLTATASQVLLRGRSRSCRCTAGPTRCSAPLSAAGRPRGSVAFTSSQ